MSVRDDFIAHVKELEAKAIDGDMFAVKSLSAIALLVGGWSPDDGDPVEYKSTTVSDPVSGKVFRIASYPLKRAA